MALGENKADAICALYDHLKADRYNWESHWEEVAERIYPQVKDSFDSNYATKGEKRNQEVFDSTAMVALNRFAAILDSLLTPRNQEWHKLIPADRELRKNRQARLYYEEVNKILFRARYAPSANFSGQNQMSFKNLGAFGSAGLFIDELMGQPERGVRYKNVHLAELFFAENHQGIIDTVVRCFKMTVRQAVQRFGEERLSSALVNKLETHPEDEYEFLHYVGPNEDLDLSRADFKGMRFASFYVEMGVKEIIEEGGFNTFPYAPSRYEQAPNEVYGRSPAMEILPSIKTLNEQKKTLLKQGHRAVDPVYLVHDDGILDNFSVIPGAANAGGVTKDGRPLVQTLPVGNVNAGRDMMEDERQLIKDSFLVTLFQILTENPQMTATEVLERTKEKGILLAPTLGRQESERLGPQIERELDLLSRMGMLPEPPPVVQEAGAAFDIIYDSPLSRAQRSGEAAGLMRTFEMTIGHAQATGDVSGFDHFNMDAIIPDLADINAVPTKWLNSLEDIQRKRQARAQQQQQQQAIQAAPSVAAVSKATQG